MDLNSARTKQKDLQERTLTQPIGMTRIGRRDPLTGRYEVISPDGGVNPNGVKVFSAQSISGDPVVSYPRPDGTIALDSDKGNPTVFPDVFNKPKEENKPNVWIFYEVNGRLYIGGHEPTPIDVGAVPYSYFSGNPNNYHIWGDSSGWIATWLSYESNSSIVTFHTALSDESRMSKTFDLNSVLNESIMDTSIYMEDVSFPLGGGYSAFRSRYWVAPSASYDVVVTIGHINRGIKTTTTIGESSGNGGGSSSFNSTYSVVLNGSTVIPHLKTPLLYQSNHDGLNITYGFDEERTQNVPVNFATESIIHYAILSDANSTYYIKETVETGGSTVLTNYSLFSTLDPSKPIASRTDVPLFFGIRWDLRAPPVTLTASYSADLYSRPFYFYPYSVPLIGGNGRSVEPVGFYRRSVAGYLPTNPFTFEQRWEIYESGTPVTFSGGSVVRIPSSEITKSQDQPGLLKRQSVAHDGKITEMPPGYCYQIPSSAKIHHWSTTT